MDSNTTYLVTNRSASTVVYSIPEEGIKLIKYMFEIIEEKNSSSNEKEILIKYLKSISSYGIRNDETLKNKLEDLYEK